ncbi:hypothetical protein B0G75_120128, partial [Paraburkholderia sp. BL18I3N2]
IPLLLARIRSFATQYKRAPNATDLRHFLIQATNTRVTVS